ncbi:Vacuolar protein sorting-associated protein 51-like [Vitis vinifera]|uniref:Vacuolar protein sorting-associated protein 51 homolog n=1 Tax=Vitis vinifera TaxID=29760 RepID=A0A438E1D7_VITVI|nr:Vacuolar protein sorting-associated protein 51-like [Vitis vinifera]
MSVWQSVAAIQEVLYIYEYINMRTQKISVLLRKRFTTPNWVKHKEPREVHMFVDLFLQEESVVTTVVKLCLKSLHEFVRLQTFNRSGLQQIQLDIQFLRVPLKEIVEDEAAIDFLLDEVIVSAAERCLDPIPLEPPILDKLIQAKLAKTKEQTAVSS